MFLPARKKAVFKLCFLMITVEVRWEENERSTSNKETCVHFTAAGRKTHARMQITNDQADVIATRARETDRCSPHQWKSNHAALLPIGPPHDPKTPYTTQN